jgi:hypothetical protein
MRIVPMALLALAAGAVLASGGPASATDTVTGEVIDLGCYMLHPESSHGAAHKMCARGCIQKGMPMGLLTGDKQVYLLLEDHDNPKPYGQLKDKVAETVTVEGDKVSQGGTQGLIVEAIK